MSMGYKMYPEEMVKPMREELTSLGVKELLTTEDVVEHLPYGTGTALVVVNSVCGCAAGQCRPGIAKALQHDTKPEHLYTVFAGQDKEATDKAREYFAPHPPSSPSIALMKDGDTVFFMPRQAIEDKSAEEIAAVLTGVFDQYCK